MVVNPSQYGFDFNTREIATLTYLALALAALILWQPGRNATLGVIRAFFAPPLARVWAAMTIYVVTSVGLRLVGPLVVAQPQVHDGVVGDSRLYVSIRGYAAQGEAKLL